MREDRCRHEMLILDGHQDSSGNSPRYQTCSICLGLDDPYEAFTLDIKLELARMRMPVAQ